MGKSLSEIQAELKRRGLQGDKRRSLAMGEADPRNRSGARASIATGLRYVQDQLQVDKDGRLGIADEAIRTETIHRETIKEIRVGGEIVIPAKVVVVALPFVFRWNDAWSDAAGSPRAPTVGSEASTVTLRIGIDDQWFCEWAPPADMDFGTDITVRLGVHADDSADAGDAVEIDFNFWAFADGGDLNAAATLNADKNTTLGADGIDSEMLFNIPSANYASTDDLFRFRFHRINLTSGVAPNGTVGMHSVKLTYTTQAQTIAVTEA